MTDAVAIIYELKHGCGTGRWCCWRCNPDFRVCGIDGDATCCVALIATVTRSGTSHLASWAAGQGPYISAANAPVVARRCASAARLRVTIPLLAICQYAVARGGSCTLTQSPPAGREGEGEGSVVCLGNAFDDCQAEADTCVVGADAFSAAPKRLVKRGDYLPNRSRPGSTSCRGPASTAASCSGSTSNANSGSSSTRSCR